jgi:amino acid permease
MAKNIDAKKVKRTSGESANGRTIDEDPEKSLTQADYDYNVDPPSGPQHQYGVGGVGMTQRRLSARHVTFIGFGGGIGTGLFIGTGSALAKAGPAGLLIAYIVVGAILWCIMECLGEMATYVSTTCVSAGFDRLPAPDGCLQQESFNPTIVLTSTDSTSRYLPSLCHTFR